MEDIEGNIDGKNKERNAFIEKFKVNIQKVSECNNNNCFDANLALTAQFGPPRKK
jgi:hypothetical protein